MAQRKVNMQHHYSSRPFHVEAGKLEGNGERNYKVLDQFVTLADAIKCVASCQGYHFIDLLYVDAEGLVWTLDLQPQVRN